jgi:hypothetical protein
MIKLIGVGVGLIKIVDKYQKKTQISRVLNELKPKNHPI